MHEHTCVMMQLTENIYIYKAELENVIQVNNNIHIYIKYAVLHTEIYTCLPVRGCIVPFLNVLQAKYAWYKGGKEYWKS